jgi:hypothetical protein
MARELAAILRDLESVDLAGDDYMSRLYDLAAELEAAPDRSKAIGSVFSFMERHPDADLGTPGPLVHFLELFSGPEYETPLVASLSRQPTPMTVWMLNRLINSLRGSDRERYIEILRSLSSESNPNISVRERASRYLTHQTAH